MNKTEKMPEVKRFSCLSICGMRKKYPYSCNGDSCNFLLQEYKSFCQQQAERIKELEEENREAVEILQSWSEGESPYKETHSFLSTQADKGEGE